MEIKPQVILSVDDNDVDGALLERAFKRGAIPARLFRVSEGPQALSYLSGEGIYMDRVNYPLPDLVLLDLGMPKMSGLDVLSWIRQHPVIKKTVVLILTSSEKPDDYKAATKNGANGYLLKPTKFEDLKTLVKTIYSEWLDKSKKPKAAKKPKADEAESEVAPVQEPPPASGHQETAPAFNDSPVPPPEEPRRQPAEQTADLVGAGK